ncbi:hypothetical protein ACTXGQ_05695 [Marinobacter sp. 1Y8]
MMTSHRQRLVVMYRHTSGLNHERLWVFFIFSLILDQILAAPPIRMCAQRHRIGEMEVHGSILAQYAMLMA